MNLKAIKLMLAYLILAALLVWLGSVAVDRLMAAKADSYNIYVWDRTGQEVGR